MVWKSDAGLAPQTYVFRVHFDPDESAKYVSLRPLTLRFPHQMISPALCTGVVIAPH
jgi:hypothetical protein